MACFGSFGIKARKVCLTGSSAYIRRNCRDNNSLLFVVIIVTVTVIFCENAFLVVLASPIDKQVDSSSEINVKKDNNTTFGVSAKNSTGPKIVGGNTDEIVEYEVGRILRCEAFGRTKPKVNWEHHGKSLPPNLLVFENPEDKIQALALHDAIDESEENTNPYYNSVRQDKNSNFSRTSNNSSTNNDLKNSEQIQIQPNITSWIGLKLPMLNMAFYGEFVCKAVNEDGTSTKTYYLIHNANSSVLMKLLRGSVALILLLSIVGFYRLCIWYGIRQKIKRYEKLPSEELKIVRRFQDGIKATKSPIIPTLTQNKSYISTITEETLDLSGIYTASIEINSWAKFVSYDDAKEVYRDCFEIDFGETLQSNSYGVLLPGKIRSPRTMKWQRVAVKTRKMDSENDLYVFEGLLSELKVLASLHDENYCIVNLQAAFTRKLYNREIYLFVDYCENGSLDRFIDLNRHKFRNLTFNKSYADEVTPPPTKKRIMCNDENQNSSPHNEPRGWTFSTEDLIVWSAEVADGMRFLHKHKVMHGNLCTANVFLTEELVAKIGNIGYAPKQSHIENYKGLPPECHLQEEYSAKSDVWSFGMTLNEIFSLRADLMDSPNSQDILDFFSMGKPLKLPKYANMAIEKIMEKCWNPDENQRPDFTYLSESLRHILKEF